MSYLIVSVSDQVKELENDKDKLEMELEVKNQAIKILEDTVEELEEKRMNCKKCQLLINLKS